jgi:ABC-2 type transport system ATP-binding protein
MERPKTDTAIATRGLRKDFAGRSVVADLDFTVPRGSVYGFLGQNGAGKTTTMRLILGLMDADAGSVDILDQRVLVQGRNDPAARLRVAPRIGALVEGPSFYPYLSGRQNLSLFARLSGVTDSAKIEEALERVELRPRGGDLFRVYSRGMKQRLGLAAALIHKPDLVLLDEPMNGLDPPGVILVRDILVELAKHGTTILLSSHILHDAELLCTHAGILHQGILVAEGPLAELCAADLTLIEVQLAKAEERSKAKELLEARDDVASLSPQGEKSLLVELKGSLAPQINRALVSADIDVAALLPKPRSLESVFLDKIRPQGAS